MVDLSSLRHRHAKVSFSRGRMAAGWAKSERGVCAITVRVISIIWPEILRYRLQ
jgi:hypothetical protein